MRRLTKASRVGLGAAALAIPMQLVSAWSALASTLDASPSTYATQAVAASAGGGTIRIPASFVNIEYTTSPSTGSASASNFTVVFTLPSGVTPSGTVTALVIDGGNNCADSVALPGVVSGSTMTFTVPTLAGGTPGGTCSVSPNDLVLTGANSLQTPTSSTRAVGFRIAAQLTAAASDSPFPLDAAPRHAPLASSANGLVLAALPFGIETDIDTAVGDSGAIFNGQPAPGRVFLPSGGSDQLLNQLGSVFIGIDGGTVAADGFTPFSFDIRIPATLTLSGNFTGISAIFLDPGAGCACGCAATADDEAAVGGVIPGAISSGAATFTVPLSVLPDALCEYASGSAVIGANPSGLGVTASLPSTNGMPGTTVTATDPFGPSVYTVGTPYFVTYTGHFAGGYAGFLRVVNNSAAPIQVYANVQADSGSLGSTMVESGLAAFTNDLVPVSTIMANAGVAASTRASLILFTAPAGTVQNGGSGGFGAGAVGISHLLLNPDGTLVQLGGNSSP